MKDKYSLKVEALLIFPYLINIFNSCEEKQDAKSKFGVINKLNLFINSYRMHCLSQ